MSFFKRLFNVGKAEAHSALDKLEDPIKLTEQGIRDLKEDLNKSMQGLAELKALAIRTKRDHAQALKEAENAEQKAVLLLQRAQAGQLAPAEADRLAGEMLSRKQEASQRATRLQQELASHESNVNKMSQNISKLKSQVSSYENELRTLKARAKVSEATKKINKTMSQIDSSGTVAMLERMKDKVQEQEALAESYAELAGEATSVDDEVNKALEGAVESDALLELKAKMGMLPQQASPEASGDASTPPPPPANS
ncbi:MAG: PspA/IM30 family protein [Bernardetiaceae bacterium]